MIAVALCVLALGDASFSGFRAHAGRDGRISKRQTQNAAAFVGAVAGAIVLCVLAVSLLTLIATDAASRRDLDAAGGRMLTVYLAYAVIVAAGFGAYYSPWLEVRSLATMLVLGPGTFVRPLVIFGGAAAASSGSPRTVAIAAFVAAGLMMLVEPALWRWFDARQEPLPSDVAA